MNIESLKTSSSHYSLLNDAQCLGHLQPCLLGTKVDAVAFQILVLLNEAAESHTGFIGLHLSFNSTCASFDFLTRDFPMASEKEFVKLQSHIWWKFLVHCFQNDHFIPKKRACMWLLGPITCRSMTWLFDTNFNWIEYMETITNSFHKMFTLSATGHF